MVNTDFAPTPQQRTVLNVFRDEYQLNPRLIRDMTGLERQRVQDALDSLTDSGWVEKRTRGLYRLVYDGESYVEIEVARKGNER